ncbi:PEP-CTERM sorting domain-containing protein [Colwellia sp. BRX10-4]|uniref:PEP-CTERM sorting domain-containing protein n=1 Tax=Colwellia sp. BRX10-4 TaxID=2759843 RepID=UPI002174FBCF|nr:PEP-CTERM sorting domain-containing protein [Colwellia sp. BRX10-4]
MVLAITTSCLSNAGLITDHDGYVTDSVTGWQWLDARFTDNMSYNDVLASTTSGSLIGWEIASTSEVLGLLLHQNNNVLIPTTGTGRTWDTSIFSFKALVMMLGDGSYYGDNANHGYLNGMTTEISSYSNRAGAPRTVQIGWWSDKVAQGFLRDDSWGPGSHSTTNIRTNTWLVKKAEVPEPSTLAIFALGMIGLASRRFKKQS